MSETIDHFEELFRIFFVTECDQKLKRKQTVCHIVIEITQFVLNKC